MTDTKQSSAQPASIINPVLAEVQKEEVQDTTSQAPVEQPQQEMPIQQPQLQPQPINLGFKIKKVSADTHYIRALIYGSHGAGKTLLAATASDVSSMREVLMLSAEGGGVVTVGRLQHGIHQIEINSYDQMDGIYRWLREHLKAFANSDYDRIVQLHNLVFPDNQITHVREAPRFRTVIIDSISELQKYVMMKLLGGSSTTNVNLASTPEQAQFKEWGQGAEMIRTMLRAFRDLPCHTIFVASVREKEDELKRIFYKPNLPGQLASEVQGFMDFVGFLTVLNNAVVPDPNNPGQNITVNNLRRIVYQPGERWAGKSRLVIHEGTVYQDNPTIASLFKGMVK